MMGVSLAQAVCHKCGEVFTYNEARYSAAPAYCSDTCEHGTGYWRRGASVPGRGLFMVAGFDQMGGIPIEDYHDFDCLPIPKESLSYMLNIGALPAGLKLKNHGVLYQVMGAYSCQQRLITLKRERGTAHE